MRRKQRGLNVNQVFYLIREGFRNTWQNRLMALASVGVLVCCLLLTGFSYLLYVNVEKMFQNAYEQNVVAVYLDTHLTDAQVEQVGEHSPKRSFWLSMAVHWRRTCCPALRGITILCPIPISLR